MKPPVAKNADQYAVKWLGIDNETMYSGAMTKEEAERLLEHPHWHSKAFPSIEKLKERIQ